MFGPMVAETVLPVDLGRSGQQRIAHDHMNARFAHLIPSWVVHFVAHALSVFFAASIDRYHHAGHLTPYRLPSGTSSICGQPTSGPQHIVLDQQTPGSTGVQGCGILAKSPITDHHVSAGFCYRSGLVDDVDPSFAA